MRPGVATGTPLRRLPVERRTSEEEEVEGPVALAVEPCCSTSWEEVSTSAEAEGVVVGLVTDISMLLSGGPNQDLQKPESLEITEDGLELPSGIGI